MSLHVGVDYVRTHLSPEQVHGVLTTVILRESVLAAYFKVTKLYLVWQIGQRLQIKPARRYLLKSWVGSS